VFQAVAKVRILLVFRSRRQYIMSAGPE